MFTQAEDFLEPIKALHRQIRDSVVEACEQQSTDALSEVASDEAGDTIFAIDRVSEEVLIEVLTREVASHTPIVLIAEGIEPDGVLVLPEGVKEADAKWRIIVDPIDGTRGIMYQKRSAWILTGVAPNRGPDTCLADIELAVQTEIPLVKQHLSDTLWASKGQGAHGERTNRISGDIQPLEPMPSQSRTLENGFATVAKFFPGLHEILGGVNDDWMREVLGPPVEGKAQCFEDQYISSGGQIYELIIGHDRLVADLRPLVEKKFAEEGKVMGLCSHPYDLCTELIAREAGVMICDEQQKPLTAPLNIHANVIWIGVANRGLAEQILPALQGVLDQRGLL
jgi:fructose-1,6-bisphosphatase/inositol monophosphatase family enzyme